MSRIAVSCCAKRLFWPVSVAVMSRLGRYLLYEVAVLARIAVLAVICNMKWLFWHVSVAAMSRWPLFAV